jgi:WD40 repeat protein
VAAVAFSPDGKTLATACYDGHARLWEVASSRMIRRLPHHAPVTHVAFSPSGSYLATASTDKSARVWDWRPGRELARLPHEDRVNSVAFQTDDRYLATACQNGRAQVWRWRLEELLDEACHLLTRNLNPTEWRRYLGQERYRKTCPGLP